MGLFEDIGVHVVACTMPLRMMLYDVLPDLESVSPAWPRGAIGASRPQLIASTHSCLNLRTSTPTSIGRRPSNARTASRLSSRPRTTTPSITKRSIPRIECSLRTLSAIPSRRISQTRWCRRK
ncbi:hypothetical protein M0657_010247 [Pyricularia oryzae]|nr:hypothetical protein M9X92_010315 [Pyricularia oryzae]KAI7912907.1 hypothetical protein M0657_010247 [Pyricularia oryzae]